MAYDSFAQLLEAAAHSGSVAAAALEREALDTGEQPADLRQRMAERLRVMREAVEQGLSGTARSRSGLVGGDAAKLAASQRGPIGGVFAEALAGALAVAEVNAAMGRIVAAPTGGASGVLPGVLLVLAREHALDDDMLVDALFTASAIGAIIAARTNLSGAAAGCQAETGAAAAMAAGAACEMLGGSPEQVGQAAALALQGVLGLVCDPVGGLVEVPCVMRNATAASVALAGLEMAMSGVTFPVPFDEVAEALASVGRSLPPSLRETARGGLAVTETGRELAGRAGASRCSWRAPSIEE